MLYDMRGERRVADIEVTSKDIYWGVRASNENCPIARAAKRAGIHLQMSVLGIARLRGRGLRWLGWGAAKFTLRFDGGWPVLPATFRIRL